MQNKKYDSLVITVQTVYSNKINMSTRSRLEREVSNIQKKIKNAPKDTPMEIRKLWEQELVNRSFELNNLVDGDEDNNLD